MTVWVDDMWSTPMGRFGRMKMSHMIADSRIELLRMADRIGLSRRWLQHPGTHNEHFDVSLDMRRRAVEAGAVEITMRELALRIRARRNLDPFLIL